MSKEMTGAAAIIQALVDQGVDTIFGYPGGAVLPIYDEIFCRIKFGTFWCATNKAPCMPPKAMRGRPASRVLFW